MFLWAIVDHLQKDNWDDDDMIRGLYLVVAMFALQVVAAVSQGLSDFVSVRMATRTRHGKALAAR